MKFFNPPPRSKYIESIKPKISIAMINKITAILNEFGVQTSAISSEVNFVKDLGLDSLDMVDLMMRLEQEFGVRIPDEDHSKIATVGDLVNYLKQEQGIAVPA